MGLTDGLRVGMAVEDARKQLRGWCEATPSAFLSPDKTHLYYTVEFRPPNLNDERPLRLTFDNGKLLIWGESADPGPLQTPAAG